MGFKLRRKKIDVSRRTEVADTCARWNQPGIEISRYPNRGVEVSGIEVT